jgi:DNA polymerase-3 subunit gamma/tau
MSDRTGKSEPNYTVVARRYRPQAFAELVGQSHIKLALENAINMGRVGHAYLFTGARGVGKTSTARIFAKCLNCVQGPTVTPCNECDICKSVSIGEDVDVLEIDGATNRRIEEIRQLRSNVNIRPSRARFKIYIIDEVHMLTNEAFNALLKTLEEPPEHVKFIFCTTDPHKIPITVLSRCQRFDFSPVETDEITARLQHIAQKENVKPELAALQLIARRAGGSMRDSQSLLEQILSYNKETITVDDVQNMLGIADMGHVAGLVTSILAGDMPSALAQVDEAIRGGVEVGQLVQQLVGYLRDMMVVKVGGGENLLLQMTTNELAGVRDRVATLGLPILFSMLQILDASIARMQYSQHARILLEASILQCCELENLQSISDLLAGLGEGTESAPAAPKKKLIDVASAAPVAILPAASAGPTSTPANEPPNLGPPPTIPSENGTSAAADVSAPPSESNAVRDVERVDTATETVPAPKLEAMWRNTLAEVGGMTADFGADFKTIEMVGANQVRIVMGSTYQRDLCNRPERKPKFEDSLGRQLGRRVSITFEGAAASADQASGPKTPRMSRMQRIRTLHEHPFVKDAIEIFGGEVVDFSEKRPDSSSRGK